MKIAALFSAGLFAAGAGATNTTATCKCFPGDRCWPSPAEWSSFNQTVGGRLIATVPLAEACHEPNYNAEVCQSLREQWQFPDIHMNNSASIMAPPFAHQSCDPFTDRSLACSYGNYVRYAVAVESSADVIRTIQFAQEKNIRFVIRNTGHDYLGRSTGAGALSVWTRGLKDITFKTWEDAYYQGPAVKLGAGVQGYEALDASRKVGQVVVGGECPTVGVAGGYTQGGGHSALSTSFGLSADNTLEFEVVTAAGNLVTASRSKNSDLYWALSGGGGGNYGVVISMTVKSHPDAVVGGATLSFFTTNNPKEAFYAAIKAFHDALPAMVDSGTMVVYYFTSSFFMISPVTAYNKTAAETEAILAPYMVTLDSLNIKYDASFSESISYYDHYDKYFGPLPTGNIQIGIAQYGARLVPLSVVENNGTELHAVARSIAEKGVTWIGVGTDVSKFGINNTNAVLPAWRKALVHATLTTEWSFDPTKWDEMLAKKEFMTNEIMPAIEAVTPGSGAYINEADPQQPNFQKEFFGANYKKLLSIKDKYDPNGFFYNLKAVGSEAWSVSDSGRMCKVPSKCSA